MAHYVLRRLVTLMITLIGIMVVTFFIYLVVPLDPLASIAGPQAPQETVDRLRGLYGFDQPIYVQFGRYIQRLARGDLGTSFQTGRPVLADILHFFPATIELATLALIISIVVGIPLNMDGSEGPMAVEARSFARRLSQATGLPVHERDERLSSVEADRRLRDLELPRGKRREKGRRDRLAAAVLLEDFLAESG